MLTLGQLCDLVAGRVTLVIELKSRFDGDRRLVARAAEVLSHYAGPAAVMSFDAAQIAALRALAPALPRGTVAERYRRRQGEVLSARARHAMAYVPQALRTRLQFLAYAVKDLPGVTPLMARSVLGLPLLTWTVRTEEDRQRAARWADQMIFEGFRP
jgi:glycerophosphoryl diester phosphodiesterase